MKLGYGEGMDDSLPLSPWLLQMRRQLAQILAWCSVHKISIITGFMGFFLMVALGVGYYFRQPLTQFFLKQEQLPSTPLPVVSTPDQSAELLGELQDKIANLEKQYEADQQYRDQLTEDFQSALHELAQNNDLLVKSGQQLDEAVQAVRTEVRALTVQQSPSEQVSSTSTYEPEAEEVPVVSGKVHLNTATAAELDSLPGIGPAYAERIIAYRAEHGNFKSIDELGNVAGIGDATIGKIRDLVEL